MTAVIAWVFVGIAAWIGVESFGRGVENTLAALVFLAGAGVGGYRLLAPRARRQESRQ